MLSRTPRFLAALALAYAILAACGQPERTYACGGTSTTGPNGELKCTGPIPAGWNDTHPGVDPLTTTP